jgi:iron(III) transport system permease protein
LAFLLLKALGLGPMELLSQMAKVGLPVLLARVGLLASLATALALLWSLPLAWLTSRTDLPGRGLIHWLAPLPLAIPPYIGAFAYQIVFGPKGLIAHLPGEALGPAAFFNIYSLPGAAWVLSLFLYPYIYLLARFSLDRAVPVLEEAAQAAGLSRWARWRSVTLPLLKPALLAGCLMVFLDGWSDFGVVSLLRVTTLTTTIYAFIQGTMDWSTPAALGLVLTMVTGLVLLAQIRILGRARYCHASSSGRPLKTLALGRARWIGLCYALLVLGFSLFLPLMVLVLQTARLGASGLLDLYFREARYILNSLATAAGGASLALVLALALGWFGERLRRRPSVSSLLQLGYAIPGTVLGLGLLGFLYRLAPWLTTSGLVLILGYLILFSLPSFQAVKAALEQVPPSMEEAARSLGRGPVGALREVVLPVAGPGLAAAWVLVFVLALRELSATIILRPPGLDTIPVRIWIHTMDVGPDPRASALALLLVALVGFSGLGAFFIGSRLGLGWRRSFGG